MDPTWRLASLSVVVACVVGCAEEDTYDAFEPALSGVRGAMRSADADLERASDTTFYRGYLNAYSADPRLPEPSYEDGRWTFEKSTGTVVFAFTSTDGTPVRDPDEPISAMTIDATETIDNFLGYPVDVTAIVHSETIDPDTDTPSIIASRVEEGDYEVGDEEVTVRLGTSLESTASAVIVDRGEGVVPRYCPQGEVRGVSKAWGSADAPHGAGEKYGETELDFEAHFEGNELVWQASEGDTLVDEGRMLTRFAEGC